LGDFHLAVVQRPASLPARALILTGPHTETAPVAVEGYIGTTFANWNELAAAGVVLVVPALLATVIVQRGFVRGLTFGAVKQ
jgi:multiple sugar transport system permease protein